MYIVLLKFSIPVGIVEECFVGSAPVTHALYQRSSCLVTRECVVPVSTVLMVI